MDIMEQGPQTQMPRVAKNIRNYVNLACIIKIGNSEVCT